MHTWFSAPASKSTLTTAARAARISFQLLKLMWFPWLCAETSLQHGPIVGAVDVHTRGGLNVYIPILFILICLHATQRVCVCAHSEKFQYVTGFWNNDCQKPSTQGQTDHVSRRQQKNLFGGRMVEGITCKNHGVAKWQKSPYKWNIAEYQCDISYTTIFPWAKRRSGCTSCEGGLDVSSVEKSHENLLAN